MAFTTYHGGLGVLRNVRTDEGNYSWCLAVETLEWYCTVGLSECADIYSHVPLTTSLGHLSNSTILALLAVADWVAMPNIPHLCGR